uniref:NADH-ubiquinone oxidoreductase chain 2 n=1 Tax=Lepidochelys olivacea TaxID=27788 RepID=B6GV36_LEPOA|nr:NADH dehydrogenase subunit 2 [Lepidochelys olivacea]ABE96686.1 NADH dehydrogenase subunit 2 [Lepidochelys olivacea]AFP52751.1 NADH dehydrogenase subunit 2 [Lepidochelys olivacea]AFP52906.1 NADH dehydrogenase subunit 2 [Lepidochelys olivacea]CAJ90454.1 NADH dehydrogenase subunit 2 [Lepidochelys olivacea]
MNPQANMIIIPSLILGPLLTISSNHWILAWTGLEISTLAIIPMIAKQHHPRATEAATKYFLTQATASTLILFSSIINAWTLGQWNITQMSNNMSCTILTTALAIKLGLAPFHFWLPEVMQGTSTATALILATWQKLAPLSLLTMTAQSLNTSLLMTLGLMSALIGGWNGLNQTQLRKIMAFSSIAHLGWMATILTLSPKLMLLTFYTYTMMTSTMFLMIKLLETNKISVMMTSWTKLPIMNTLMMLTLMSLAGMPPLTGFMPKWLIIQELTKQHMFIMATMMAMLSLLTLFFYLRISYYTTITLPPNSTNYSQQWRHKMKQKPFYLALLTTLSTIMLPITPTLLTIP